MVKGCVGETLKESSHMRVILQEWVGHLISETIDLYSAFLAVKGLGDSGISDT